MGLSRQQEGFIQSLLEGKKQVDAYKNNYSCKTMSDKSIHEEASKLRKNPKVSPRYEKLKEELDKNIQKETLWSKERLIEAFEDNFNESKGNGDIRVRNDSLKEIGKLCGHYVEKVELSEKMPNIILKK